MKGVFLLKKFRRGITVIKNMKNWQDYFLNSFGLIQRKLITLKMKDGLFYIIRTKTLDRHLFAETVLEDQYLLNHINLNKNSVIIDLGAQIGFFSIHASGKAGKILAFEPVPENFELLKKNIELNKLENKILAFNSAVSGKKGKEKIFLSGTHSGGHSIYGFKEPEQKKDSSINYFLNGKGFSKKKFIEVPAITLDEIFTANKIKECDLLKMDIEGAEYNVFYELNDSCFTKIQRIVMEVHGIDEKKKNLGYLMKFLESKEYKVKIVKAVLFAEKNQNK